MKKYESVFILDERQFEDQGKSFAEEFPSFIKELGGNVEQSLPMGRRQFARKLKKKKSGIYYDFILSLEEDKVISIRNKYHLDARVLRFMVFIYDEKAAATAANSKKLLEGEE